MIARQAPRQTCFRTVAEARAVPHALLSLLKIRETRGRERATSLERVCSQYDGSAPPNSHLSTLTPKPYIPASQRLKRKPSTKQAGEQRGGCAG